MSAIIEIEEAKATATGMRYRVWHDGEVILDSSRIPMFDACREMVKRGVTGRLQMKRKGRDQIDAECLIAVGATLSVTEGQELGPRVSKYAAFSFGDTANEGMSAA